MRLKAILTVIYNKILSAKTKLRLEKFIFVAAMIGFFLHLGVIWLVHLGVIDAGEYASGFSNPVNAIYTPFSIILYYEVYCLIYYLPKSMTVYIGKQFEVIALITIREIFKEIPKLKISSDLDQMYSNPQFIYTLITILVLFFLIYLYYAQNQKSIRSNNSTKGIPDGIPKKKKKYILAKKFLALVIGVIFVMMVVVNLVDWFSHHSLIEWLQNTGLSSRDLFSSFFLILILSDVIILLFSFAVTDDFPKVMRNSGFVVSTTLIRLSFSVEGLASHIMIVMAVLFGTLMVAVYKRYKKIELPSD
ncbi:hypothetical protein PSM36_2114 [Proteiniphilum saccharofermentans]|uniref:Uncharacterized protein n=1 Tax=Proteiniphilum saccharofermentans TaxID=1642647 RepID=A0A1R3SZJ9_9BACT|nr:hypothetical protein [Proteiniphilum saccharofermentans]SCD20921.1 hypothetical protein PSM36_2114 [Proteiniphilum saccharofermentans]